MAEIVNLNRARKARTRTEAEATAAVNRAKHGRTAVERGRDEREEARRRALLDGAKRDDACDAPRRLRRAEGRRGMTRALARIAPMAVLLAACAGEPLPTPPPPRPASGTAAAAPAGPVTRFDGRYAGPLALLPDRTRVCPAAPAGERELTVRNGRASLMFNPQVQQVLTGTVGTDGSVRMADSLDRNIATSGIFTAENFRGEHRNGLCAYSVQMTKRG